MASPLLNLNPLLRVVQYNGGPIYGQYGISSAFSVEPGASTRASATRAGTTFDVVLQYTGPATQSISLDQIVVISPKFEEVTAMLKAGVVWVHPHDSPFLTSSSDSTPESSQAPQLDISYSRYFNDFHRTKKMPEIDQNDASKISSLPKPAAIFDYQDTKGPLTIGVVDSANQGLATGQLIHIKFTETFDDDYNVDFGHFYVIGRENTIVSPTTASQTDSTEGLYGNTVSIQQRQWLLQNGIISTPSVQSVHNVILTPQNHAALFGNTASVFVSAKPIHQYLEYIDGGKDLSPLSAEERELIKHFIKFTTGAEIITNAWRQFFAADLITTNLQKETGTGMVLGKKNQGDNDSGSEKRLEVPPEMYFFTIDPTTPKQLRNVVLGHLGELVVEKDGLDPRQVDVQSDQLDADKMVVGGQDLVLKGNKLFSIMTCSAAGPSQKFKFDPKLDTSTTPFSTPTAQSSLVPSIHSFLTEAITKASNVGVNGETDVVGFFARGSVVTGFLHEYYEQLAKQLRYVPTPSSTPTPTTTPAPAAGKKKAAGTVAPAAAKGTQKGQGKVAKKAEFYNSAQIAWFSSLLPQQILSQTPQGSLPSPHPIYQNTAIASYYALEEELKGMIRKEGQEGPKCLFVMPVDKTTDAHLEICANLLEFSSILPQFQTPSETNEGDAVQKCLDPFRVAIFDVLGNNVNDVLYSHSKFLVSARLFISLPTSHTQPAPDALTMTTTTTAAAAGKTGASAKAPAKKSGALDRVAPPVKKFSLPLYNLTPLLFPQQGEEEISVSNQLYAVDIEFEKIIDPTMLEFAQEAEEETPPPTIIELVSYLAKVQGFLRTALQLGPTWSIVPFVSDQTPWAQRFGQELGKLNGLLDDISYLRMLHSTIIPSIYARFAIQEDRDSLDQIEKKAEATSQGQSDQFELDSVNTLAFAPDSNEDKLFRALAGFTKRAEMLLGRVPAPVGLCPIPFSTSTELSQLSSTASALPYLPTEKIMDWDDDESLFIPQLMTLMAGIGETKGVLALVGQGELQNEQCVDLKQKMVLLRQGTDNTMELINDRVRVIVEVRDCLMQVMKFVENFPQLTIDLVKKEKNAHLSTFFSLFQFSLHNTGLRYTHTQATLNPSISKTIAAINNILNIQPVQVGTQNGPNGPNKGTFYFAEAFSPEAPILTKSTLSRLCPNSEITIPIPTVSLYESITAVADLFTKQITQNVKAISDEKFDKLKKSGNFVELVDQIQLERCLEGYLLLTPQVTASGTGNKLSLSRTAVNKAAAAAVAAKDSLNNKKVDGADDRIIILWITHILDGTFAHLDNIQREMQALVETYKSGGNSSAGPEGSNHQNGQKSDFGQDIVLAKIDIDAFPEVLEIFDLGEATSLPALLFVQTQAERADLRSTAVDPKELPQLLQAGLVSMVDSPELYGIGGLEDEEGDLTETDGEEETD